jgi:hypothetical protein
LEIQTIDNKVQLFLEKKFRTSRSYATRHTYRAVVRRFLDFLRLQYNLDLEQLIRQLKETKEKDSLGILDDFYTFLSNDKIKKTGRPLSSSTVKQYVILAKELLNHDVASITRISGKDSGYQKSQQYMNEVLQRKS